MSRSGRGVARWVWLGIALALLFYLIVATVQAPDFLSVPLPERAAAPPWQAPPLGMDNRGVPLHEYALQGASIVAVPSLLGGLLVMALATSAGIVRCIGARWLDSALGLASEVVGALPRLVVVLVVAMLVPAAWRGLSAIALTWALLAAPGAMDEAAATAERLGGQRFVEALRAHGFSRLRIYGLHVVAYNLRPVIVRQGSEVTMQIVFLEIALSYLAIRRSEPSWTHPDSSYSWATLLYQGYTGLLGEPMLHALVLGLALVGLVALMAQGFRLAARAR
ncbi:MAG: hypothetical protein KTR31_15970 [Myxococcales bacterium]|nr:hypothetical protein [Myxococcales bacterium]